MPTLLKLAVAGAMLAVSVGLSQAQQGRSIEVIPAQNATIQEQTVAQASGAEAPTAEGPAAQLAAPEPVAPPQATPVIPAPPPRAERLPVRPIAAPAPKQVEKCHDEAPVYSHRAPRYHAPRYEEPRYFAPRDERYGHAPRHHYAPQHSYGYGYHRGY